MAESKFKWTGGGIRDVVLDCPMEAAWDLFSDWTNWGRWYSLPDVCELREGENRKPGCVRLLQYPNTWLHERILQIDNEKHLMSYSIDANDVLGGMKGFVGTLEFQETGDGKALVPYWKYEVEPVENQTREAYCSFADSILRNALTELERAAQKVAAGVDPKPVKPTPNTTEARTEDSVLLEKPANSHLPNCRHYIDSGNLQEEIEFNATGGGCQIIDENTIAGVSRYIQSEDSLQIHFSRRTMAKPRLTKSYVEEWKSLWQPDLDAIAYNGATCDPTRVDPKVLQWAKQNCSHEPHFIKIVNKNAVPDRPGLKPRTASYCQMTVPTPFVKQHFRKLERVVKLENEAGKTWKVSFGAPRVDSYWQQGWFRFSRDNSLKPGDVIVFVLVGNSYFHFTRFDECGNIVTSSHTDIDTATVKKEDGNGCSSQSHEEPDPPSWKRARLCNVGEKLKKHNIGESGNHID